MFRPDSLLARLVPVVVLGLVLAGLWKITPPDAEPPAAPPVISPVLTYQPLPSDPEELWSILQDTQADSVRRHQAGARLARLGEAIVPQLRSSLAARNPTLRAASVRLLFDNVSLVDQVLPQLLSLSSDPDVYLVRDVFTVIGRAGANDPRTLECLFAALRSPHEAVADSAAEALREIHPASDADRLMAALEAAPDVRRETLTAALCRSVCDSPQAIRDALHRRLERADDASATVSGASSEPFLFQVLNCLPREDRLWLARQHRQHPRWQVRGELALAALLAAPERHEEFGPDLRQAIVAARSDAVRMRKFMTGPGQGLIPKSVLAPLLTSEFRAVRVAAAINSYPKEGDTRLVGPLMEELSGNSFDWKALYSLGEIGPAAEKAVPLVEKIAEQFPPHREECASCLMRIRVHSAEGPAAAGR